MPFQSPTQLLRLNATQNGTTNKGEQLAPVTLCVNRCKSTTANILETMGHNFLPMILMTLFNVF